MSGWVDIPDVAGAFAGGRLRCRPAPFILVVSSSPTPVRTEREHTQEARGHALIVTRHTPSVEVLAIMLAKIEHETLPRAVSRAVHRAEARILESPGWVSEEIKRIAAEQAATLPTEVPTRDLFRCVPASTVQRHMASDEWRRTSPDAYRRAATASGDPASFVRSTIPSGTVVFPADRSWLIDAAGVVDLSSDELQDRLEMRPDRRPPFLVFHLTPERMVAAGVRIRRPNALDAAASQQPQWTPAGLAIGTEYVDLDVRIEAVEEILWKP